MNYKKWILILLLISCQILQTYSKPLTMEELDLRIESETFYSGTEIKTLLLEIIQIANEEIIKTSEDAVKTAVIPLYAEIAVQNQTIIDLNNSLKKKEKLFWWTVSICTALGVIVEFVFFERFIFK